MSTSVLLVCAVLASLAAGVLLAYGVCLGLFGLFRMHALPAIAAAPVVTIASVGQAAEV